MIQSLEIENFQSHKESILDFDPGVNLIIGESDQGKSAIIRSLYWLIKNRPLGDAFVNWDDPKNICSVTLINDYHTINRSIGKYINLYFLDNFDDDLALTGFNKSVPDEIIQALRIDNLNFQLQKDHFFLFNKSAPEVGRFLNSLMDLDVISTAQTHANTRVQRTKDNIENKESEIEKLEVKIKEYEPLDEIEKEINGLEQLELKIEQDTVSNKNLNEIISSISSLQRTINYYASIYKLKTELDLLILLNKEVEKDIDQYNKLVNLLNAIDEVNEQIELYQRIVDLQSELNKWERLKSSVDKIKISSNELSNLTRKIRTTQKDIDDLQSNLDKWEDEFHELMPDQCPLCLQEIK